MVHFGVFMVLGMLVLLVISGATTLCLVGTYCIVWIVCPKKGFSSKDFSIRNALYTGGLLSRGLPFGRGYTIQTIQYLLSLCLLYKKKQYARLKMLC